MADQDFKINIRTLADLTGIKLTRQELSALQTAAAQGNQKAIAALKQLSAAQKEASVGFTGSAIGVGTIISLVTGAISKWQAFNDEQDKMVEKMIIAQEKSRALGLEVVELMEEMKSLERIETEPLEQSFTRLTQKVTRLKSEMQLAFETGRYEDVKKLATQLGVVESQVDRVTAAIQRQTQETERNAAASQKAAEKKAALEASFFKGAVSTASPQVQRTLQLEDEARRAAAAGEGNLSDRLQRSAEAFKRGMTAEQRSEYEGLSGGNQRGVIDAINELKRDLLGIWR